MGYRIETWIAQTIKHDPAVQSMLRGRVYPNVAPASVPPNTPFVTYRRAATSTDHVASETVENIKASIEVMVWTEGDENAYATGLEIATRIRQCLKALQDNLPPGLQVDSAIWENEFDQLLPPELASERAWHCRVLQYDVNYYEDVPEK